MFTHRKTLFSILLALAVLASSLAWTPLDVSGNIGDGEPPEPPEALCSRLTGMNASTLAGSGNCGGAAYWYAPRPRLEVYISGNLLYVNGTRFVRRHNYNVRARRTGKSWEKLGSVRATSNGRVSDAFRLPSTLRRAPRLYVCLKDVINGRTYCAWAKRLY